MKSLCISLVLLFVACDGPGGGGGSTALPTCNNGVLDPGEICDGTSVGANTCQTAGFERGLLVCNRYCTNFDTTGCSGGNGPSPDVIGGDTSGGDTRTPDTTSTDTGSGANQAPNILSLNANTTTLNAGSNLVVTAVVTDPNGIDDLIGGQLEASTGGSYGAFSTSAAEGSYTITLTWDALNTVRPINAAAAGTALDFKAVFYDVAGLRSERSLRVTVRCDASSGRGLCEGECTDLAGDKYNCGSCNKWCQDETSFQSLSAAISEDCFQSTCTIAFYVDNSRVAAGATCKTLCTEVGLSCPWPASVELGYASVSGNGVSLACEERVPAGSSVSGATCQCAPGTGVIIPPDPEPELATIVGIQSSSASVDCTASGDQLIGAEVTLEGVVTVPRFKLNTTLSGIFVSDGTQNAYSGLLVRFPTAQAYNFTKGQKVRVTGKHYEYYCMTQFAATAITAVGDGAVPAVRTIGKNLLAADYEKWESVAVKVDNVTVTDLTQYNEAETNAGVLIDDFILDTSFLPPSITTNYAYIRGILVYGFERYRVAPRDDSDY
jgi:hypothetical protein